MAGLPSAWMFNAIRIIQLLAELWNFLSQAKFVGPQRTIQTTETKLNSFKDIEDARKYLSDIYYEKEWNKTDDYAQRLWSLVENKFM